MVCAESRRRVERLDALFEAMNWEERWLATFHALRAEQMKSGGLAAQLKVALQIRAEEAPPSPKIQPQPWVKVNRRRDEPIMSARARRNEAIRKQFAKHADLHDLSHRFNLGKDQIRKIVVAGRVN